MSTFAVVTHFRSFGDLEAPCGRLHGAWHGCCVRAKRTPVRIALFCPSYGQVGGIEEKARVLIEAFRAQGHAVTVLARGEPATSGSDGDVPVVRREYHQMPRRARHVARQLRFLRDLPRATRALRRVVSDAASEVVLTLAITSYAPYASALAAAAPLVLSLEGGEPGGRFTANPRALRSALRRVSRVVACARSLAAAALGLAPEVADRLSIIPNGVEPELFADGPAYAHPRPYVAAVGRLVPQKGFDVLLEAFARLRVPEVELLIAGDGPERRRLGAIVERLWLGARGHLLGTVTRATVASLYRGARVVPRPSRWGGMPPGCLEALGSGRAVVASRVDGIPDAVGDGETGLLVPPEDPLALADALGALLEDGPRRERLGARGRALVCAELTWASVAERYLAVLADAAAPR